MIIVFHNQFDLIINTLFWLVFQEFAPQVFYALYGAAGFQPPFCYERYNGVDRSLESV